MASPKFQFWENIQQKCTYQKLLKIFKKIYKNLHKNLKNYQNFSQIKFNRILENFKKLRKFKQI